MHETVYICMYTENSTDGEAAVDRHIYKLGPMSPTHSKRELYRSIQKGGNIPQHGLQLTAADDRKGYSFLYDVHSV